MTASRVYFARCVGPFGQPLGAIKIGFSTVPSHRIVSAARCQPYTLDLIGSIEGGWATEALLHLALRAHRIDGEFFHDNPYVRSTIERALELGRPLYYVTMGSGGDYLPLAATEAFMRYHGIALDDAAKFLGLSLKYYEGQLEKPNRRLIAATALLAQKNRRFVSWPADCVRGLLGQIHPDIRPKLPPLAAEPERVAS
jgi:hypothetical protein